MCLADASLVCKVISDLPPFMKDFISLFSLGKKRKRKEFISLHTDKWGTTRMTKRADCVIQHKSTEFGRSAALVTATNLLSSVPHYVRECCSFADFKFKVK